MLARFAQAVHPEQRSLPDEQTAALSALITRRRQLVEMLVKEIGGELATAIRESPVWRAKEDRDAIVLGSALPFRPGGKADLAYREVEMVEVKEVLRLWLTGHRFAVEVLELPAREDRVRAA